MKRTAMHCAIEKGHLQVIVALKRAGSKMEEDTLRDCADRGEQSQTKIKTMLALNSKVKQVHGAEESYAAIKPLKGARARNSWGDRVVGWGARPGKTEQDHAVSMCIAAETGDLKALRRLLMEGADADGKRAYGLTPAHCAAASSKDLSVNSLKLLSYWGADMNVKDDGGSTPLHHAALKGEAGAVQALLGLKANPGLLDSRGMLPLALTKSPAVKAMLQRLNGPVAVNEAALDDYLQGAGAFGQAESEVGRLILFVSN